MKKKHFILIGIIILVILLGILFSFYFQSKYTKFEKSNADIPKTTVKEEDLKLGEGEYEVIDVDENMIEIISDGKGNELKYKITLNGKVHTLAFKYNYIKGEEFENPGYYFNYKVLVDLYFNKTNVTNKSKFNKETVLLYETYDDRDLKSVKDSINNISMLYKFDIQIIKGSDKKDYLYLNVINTTLDNIRTSYITIINDKGDIVAEIDSGMNSNNGIKMKAKDEDMKYNEWGYYLYKNKEGITEIHYLSLEEVFENEELLRYDPYKSLLMISNNKPQINKTKLSLDMIREYKR